MRRSAALVVLLAALGLSARGARAGDADIIFIGGKVVTCDKQGTVARALAVRGEEVLRVGTDEEVLPERGPRTEVFDLQGKMVLPGLIDSHVHPGGACVTELDHPIPDMETIEDVLSYVRARAAALKKGEWIEVRQVFITRLREQRYPTREELDRAAPENPVLFATGPDASLNSLALAQSGLDKDFKVTDGGAGHLERDPRTGEPTGVLRNLTRFVKFEAPPSRKRPDEETLERRLELLLRDYLSVGLTSIGDRDASAEEIDVYRRLLEKGRLPLRVACHHSLATKGPLEEVLAEARRIALHPLRRGGPRLRVIGVKTYLDGGMLTGSAYMREPWGKSKIYAIDDPEYRGLLFIPPEKLRPIVRAVLESGLQFTAHSVGDGAVHALLDAYEDANRDFPVRPLRPCITRANFQSKEAIERMARLGVVADLQPIWLHLDGKTLLAQFGWERLRWFQPLRSLFEAGVPVGGGSDHMQKIGSFRSINPYNPFLGMWIAITREARGSDRPLHPEEALDRMQAIRFYTSQNAFLLFQEDRTGSLEKGKLADLIVIDRDLLACPVSEIARTQVLRTYVGGKLVHERSGSP
jgi:predicted amidohydrolase YtcJ